MTTKEMIREEILDQAAQDMSEFMFHITTAYKGHEPDVAGMLVSTIGAYLSICAKRPQEILDDAAEQLRKTDHGRIRAAHFGYATLGVDKPVPVKPPEGNVFKIGDPRQRRKD